MEFDVRPQHVAECMVLLEHFDSSSIWNFGVFDDLYTRIPLNGVFDAEFRARTAFRHPQGRRGRIG